MDPYKERRNLTFEQAEGIEPLPQQLALGDLSERARVRLWKVLYDSLVKHRRYSSTGYGGPWLEDPWKTILYDKHVLRDDQYADEFESEFDELLAELREEVEDGTYAKVLGLFQFILQHPKRPPGFDQGVQSALTSSMAAYRVIGGSLIVPIASDEEATAIARAFADLRITEFNGARRHLSSAAEHLTQGRWADSIRESIHAVGAVARTLAPDANTLDPALAKLSGAGHIHPALRAGFGKLYGYTNDNGGIRHEILGTGQAKVDETDALYMFGACAAFVSYLIGRARADGLLKAR